MSRPLLNRRLDGLGTTIFAEMTARAVATGSINLGQGFPDRDGPASVARAAADAILAGRGNQYPPGPGIPELRQAIAAHDARFWGLSYDPADEVLVTALASSLRSGRKSGGRSVTGTRTPPAIAMFAA